MSALTPMVCDVPRPEITTATVVDLCPACAVIGKQLRRVDVVDGVRRERRFCYTQGCGCRWSPLRSPA